MPFQKKFENIADPREIWTARSEEKWSVLLCLKLALIYRILKLDPLLYSMWFYTPQFETVAGLLCYGLTPTVVFEAVAAAVVVACMVFVALLVFCRGCCCCLCFTVVAAVLAIVAFAAMFWFISNAMCAFVHEGRFFLVDAANFNFFTRTLFHCFFPME